MKTCVCDGCGDGPMSFEALSCASCAGLFCLGCWDEVAMVCETCAPGLREDRGADEDEARHASAEQDGGR